MNGDNIIKLIEDICISLRKKYNEGIEQLKEFIPVLQGELTELMTVGMEKGIEQNEWLIVLTDIVDAMTRGDGVLLVDVLEYGLLELVEQTYDMEQGV